MKLAIFFLALIPTLIEVYLDRKGETKKGKKKDTFWLIVAVASALGLAYGLLKINPIGPAILFLAWRILLFDYLVNIVLYRNKVIERQGAEKWFSYMGESTHWWDQVVSKINPVIRFFLRFIVFLSSTFIWRYAFK